MTGRGGSRCNLCQEGPITWARTEAGKSMPIWSVPDPRGAWWWVDTPDGRRIRTASKDHPRPTDGRTRFFRAHFLDCEVHAAKKRLEQRLKAAVADAAREDG